VTADLHLIIPVALCSAATVILLGEAISAVRNTRKQKKAAK